MREITPYKTLSGARKALDNGGRFYNLFTKAGDSVVESGELARAAGIHSTDTKALLYFEMALMALPPEGRKQVVSWLSPELKALYDRKPVRMLAPSAVEAVGQVGDPAIVSGYPVFVEDKSQFMGFIIIMAGHAIIMVPIFDQFDVYEVFDSPDLRKRRTVIATTKGSKRLDGINTRFAGLLKELRFEDKTGKDHGLFLETLYYTLLG